MAVLVAKVLSPTECLPLDDSHWLPWVLWTRAWRFGLFVWKLHSGELAIMVLGVSRREQERSLGRSYPLVL